MQNQSAYGCQSMLNHIPLQAFDHDILSNEQRVTSTVSGLIKCEAELK